MHGNHKSLWKTRLKLQRQNGQEIRKNCRLTFVLVSAGNCDPFNFHWNAQSNSCRCRLLNEWWLVNYWDHLKAAFFTLPFVNECDGSNWRWAVLYCSVTTITFGGRNSVFASSLFTQREPWVREKRKALFVFWDFVFYFSFSFIGISAGR